MPTKLYQALSPLIAFILITDATEQLQTIPFGRSRDHGGLRVGMRASPNYLSNYDLGFQELLERFLYRPSSNIQDRYLGRSAFGSFLANTNRNGLRSSFNDAARNDLSARRGQQSQLGLRDNRGLQQYYNGYDMEALNQGNSLEKSNKLELYINKNDKHKESNLLNYKRGNIVGAGLQQFENVAVDQESRGFDDIDASSARNQDSDTNILSASDRKLDQSAASLVDNVVGTFVP